MLSIILAAAQAAEDDRKQIQEIPQGMLVSHGFFTKASGNVGA
jgi:hypothetical protein